MKLKFWEKFKGGFFVRGGTGKQQKLAVGEMSWQNRCIYYDRMIKDHPLAKSCINTVAGQVWAEGIYLTEQTDEKGEPYPRTIDAKNECNDLNRRISLDTLGLTATFMLGTHGSVFLEKSLDPFDVRLIPNQESIEPAQTNDIGEVTSWRQTIYGKIIAEWNSDEIIHLPWNPTSASYPYGTSLLEGLETDFEVLTQLKLDIKEFMHKNAFPKELWQVGDGQFMPTTSEIATITREVDNWQPGETHVTSYPIKREAGGTGDREVRNLNDVLTFEKQELVDGLMTPPVSFQYSSTYASSKEMMTQQRANLVVPFQRLWKRTLENEVYKPYLESLGYSVKNDLPHVSFENPEAHKVDVADYYTKLVAAKIVPPRFAAKKLGVPLEEFDAWMKEEEAKQQKLMDQKAEQAQAEQATGDVANRSQKPEEKKGET